MKSYRLLFGSKIGGCIIRAMKVTYLARLLNVSVGTIRRWVGDDVYGPFLTPSASPAKGNTRIMTEHDQRVLYYVAQLREMGLSQDAILERLRRMQESDWRDLPPVPAEWDGKGDTLPMEVAANRASEMVQSAVLQKELQHVREALQLAESRVEELETQLQTVTGEKDELVEQKHTLELEISQAKGEVSRLEAELKAYGMAYSLGGERPVSLVWIVLATAAVVTLIIVIAFVVAIVAT